MLDTVCCLKNQEIPTALWQITNRCNAKCEHCFSHRGTADADGWSGIPWKFKKLGIRRVVLTGGEPLLHPNLQGITQSLTEKEISTTLITNGILVTEDIIGKLKTAGLNSIDLSLQSSNWEIQDAIYGVRGAFNRVINAMEVCKKYEMPFSISATVLPDLESCLSELIDFAICQGAKSISINSILNPLLEASTKISKSKAAAIYVQEVIRSKRVQHGEGKIKSSRIFSPREGFQCPAGRSFWTVTCSGEWLPCLLAWEMKPYLPESYSYLYEPGEPTLSRNQHSPSSSCPIMDNAR